MLNRFITIVVLVPLAIILIALAVANRSSVPFTLDPFNPGNPGLTVHLPLFVYLFLALVAGMLIGSIATWLRQGRYRRQARDQKSELAAAQRRPQQADPSRSALTGPGA